MSRFDDRLTKELERAARPAEPAGVFDEIDRRRERRVTVRRMQTAMLAVAVFAGSIGGVLVLNRAFRGDGVTTPAITPARNGPIVVSFGDDGGTHLYLLDATDPTWDPSQHQLTNEVSKDTQPAVSPDGRTVAFVRENLQHGGLTVWTMSIDGSDPRQISPSSWNANYPVWSPDGKQIAYIGGNAEDIAVYIVGVDGNLDLRRLTSDTLGGVKVGLAWSPDGNQIAVAIANGTGGSHISLIDLGSGAASVASQTYWDLGAPSWSPDGRYLTYAHGGGIVTLELDNAKVKEVTPVQAPVFEPGSDPRRFDSDPTWSPDGEWIAFERFFSPSEFFVYAIRPDGTDLHRIGLGGEPAWATALHQTAPSEPSTSNGPTSTDSPNMQVPGVSERTCDVTSAPLEDRAVAYVYRLQHDGGCNATDPTFLAVDEGVGVVGPAFPLTCTDSCRIFSTPDLDGDGVQEIAVQTSEFPGVTIALFRTLVTYGPSSGLRIEPVHMIDDPSQPGAWRPAEFDWSLDPSASAGVYCSLTGTGNRNVIIWSATLNDATPGGHYFETKYQMLDGDMEFFHGPTERVFDPGAFDLPSFDSLCGSPIRVSALTTEGSPRSS